mmetsp:Transcript_10158/g.29145  ORF Transcript_10158/g.29145 Transcript_10158/m.29145 type:complete len:92 (+) Transcript_10158:1168-1443(+)
MSRLTVAQRVSKATEQGCALSWILILMANGQHQVELMPRPPSSLGRLVPSGRFARFRLGAAERDRYGKPLPMRFSSHSWRLYKPAMSPNEQ